MSTYRKEISRKKLEQMEEVVLGHYYTGSCQCFKDCNCADDRGKLQRTEILYSIGIFNKGRKEKLYTYKVALNIINQRTKSIYSIDQTLIPPSMVTKADIIQACTTTQLGREGMIPSGMFTAEGAVLFEQMLNSGEIVLLKESELSRHCPNPRFGLKDVNYPSTIKELLKYRAYCEHNYKKEEYKTWPSYEEYLELATV